MEIEERLGLYDCDLVGVGVEGVDVQFTFSSFKIDIGERLQPADGLIREFHEYAAIAGEPLKVGMALAVQIRAHLLDLKIGHIAHAPAERAFVIALAAELEPLDKAALREHLVGRVDEFGEAHILRKRHWRRASRWLSR